MILIVILLALVFAILLHFTSFGRGVYDIGLNTEAAHFTGVNVRRTKLILFMLAGVVSALAGIYYTLRFGSSRGDNATGSSCASSPPSCSVACPSSVAVAACTASSPASC